MAVDYSGLPSRELSASRDLVNFLEWLYLWVLAGFVVRPCSTGTISSQQLHGDLKTLPTYSCFFWLLSFTCVLPVILLYV